MKDTIKKLLAITLSLALLIAVGVNTLIPATAESLSDLAASVSQKKAALDTAQQTMENYQTQVSNGTICSEDFANASDLTGWDITGTFTNEVIDSGDSTYGKVMHLDADTTSTGNVVSKSLSGITVGSNYVITFDAKLLAKGSSAAVMISMANTVNAYVKNSSMTSLTSSTGAALTNGSANEWWALRTASTNPWHKYELRITYASGYNRLNFIEYNADQGEVYIDNIVVMSEEAYNLTDELEAAEATYKTALEEYNTAKAAYDNAVKFVEQENLSLGFEFTEGSLSDYYTVGANNIVSLQGVEKYEGNNAVKFAPTSTALDGNAIGKTFSVSANTRYAASFYVKIDGATNINTTVGGTYICNAANTVSSGKLISPYALSYDNKSPKYATGGEVTFDYLNLGGGWARVRDNTGAWHKMTLFFDSGSSTEITVVYSAYEANYVSYVDNFSLVTAAEYMETVYDEAAANNQTVSVGVTENTSAEIYVPDGYILPYGSVYTEAGVALEKTEDGKFVVPAGTSTVNVKYFEKPTGVVGTFGSSKKTDEVAIQFGSYITDTTAAESMGTFLIRGDFADMCNTLNNLSEQQIIEKLYSIYKANSTGNGIGVKYADGKSVSIIAMPRTKYMWKNSSGSELQYSLRVYDLEEWADVNYTAIGYVVNGDTVTFSTKSVSASYNG